MPPDEVQSDTTEPAVSPEPVVEPAPKTTPKEEIISEQTPLDDGPQGDSLAVNINPAENITEIHTPDTVTISEVIEPARSPTLGEVSKMPFDMKSLLPKLKEKLAFRTEKRLSKILELARKKREIQNDDVEKLLQVSDTTAAIYLKKLLMRGQLKEVGNHHWPRYSAN